MRKQFFVLLLSMALLSTVLFPVEGLAEATSEVAELRGLVTGVSPNGLYLRDPYMGEIFLNVDPDTVLEGVLADKSLTPGMYVLAKYNGQLASSIPPQARAQRLACYPLEGKAAKLVDGGVLLSGDPLFGEVVVRLSSSMPQVFPGVPLTVYYDGAMSMSLPGTVSAAHIVVPVLSGTVHSTQQNSFLLDTGGNGSHTVWLTASSWLPVDWFASGAEGHRVTVYYDGNHAGGAVTALKVVDSDSAAEESLPAGRLAGGIDDTEIPGAGEEITGEIPMPEPETPTPEIPVEETPVPETPIPELPTPELPTPELPVMEDPETEMPPVPVEPPVTEVPSLPEEPVETMVFQEMPALGQPEEDNGTLPAA